MNESPKSLGLLNKITICVLLIALLSLPYSYYMFLRWLVTISACVHLYFCWDPKRRGAVALCICIAGLFNPFVPVFLPRGIWAFLDIVSAILFAVILTEIEMTPRSGVRRQ